MDGLEPLLVCGQLFFFATLEPLNRFPIGAPQLLALCEKFATDRSSDACVITFPFLIRMYGDPIFSP